MEMLNESYPILYSFRRCPYAMRARLALYTAKISHEHREIELKNKPIEMLRLSPKGTVPVLQLSEGMVLEESLDIMNWAFGMPQTSLEDKQLITTNDTSFKYALDRYKYPGRYPEEADIDYRHQCVQFLERFESYLSSLSAGMFTFTDMAVLPFIRQCAMVDQDWFNAQPYPRLKTRLDYFISSDLFQKVMYKYPLWLPSDPPKMITF